MVQWVVIVGAGVDTQPRVELFGNGSLTTLNDATIGSVEGDGSVNIGASSTLTVGANALNTLFSGVIHDSIVSGGSLTKIDTGTLTLGGASTYTVRTTVMDGILLVANTSGSATGTSAVVVDSGTLGGSGTISGPTTIGTGSGSGAVLAPAAAGMKPATLRLSDALTFQNDATYLWTLNNVKRKVNFDEVVANGVTIQTGAKFSVVQSVSGRLSQGLILTVIENTASTPIAGEFSNLADGSTLTIGINHLKVSYNGGDGNDLTLTVVP